MPDLLQGEPPSVLEFPTLEKGSEDFNMQAGGINFGTAAGCWNHARHLERFPNVSFSAVCDLNFDLAQQRIENKKNGGEFSHKWEGCKAFRTHRDMLNSDDRPDAVIIGTPPATRGALQIPGGPVELDMAEAGIHMFMEKPVSVRPVDEVAELSARLDDYHQKNGVITGVGYMLRYSAGVDMAKKLLAKVGAQPIAVLGRMSIGYSFLQTPFWWDKERSGGPIVEQATHFVDLMRYLCGELVPDSVQAKAIGPNMMLSDMPAAPLAEHTIPMEKRVNRATTAQFVFESGCIGSLFHSACLEGARFSAELDIQADGVHIVIGNPYHMPFLKMRSSRREDYEEVEINKQGEAMYDAAFGTFLQAIREKDPKILRSSFADALKTYEATRWIADASQPTPQSAWNAPAPWVTRAQPSWTNAAAEVIQEAKEQQPEQVDIQTVLPTPAAPQPTTVPPTMPYTPGQPAWQPQAPPLILPQQRAASSSAHSTSEDTNEQ
ncbi:hypothetical protein WJX74_001899 [Apatococcus lobatus]|uniref:Oxidoreductase n=1 Tax=Apatococcus lobatus TaxID=904363 RepID=A0AAW1RH08_9CHLO